MSWTKIFLVNVLLFIAILVILEAGSGIGRLLIGKSFLTSAPLPTNNELMTFPENPRDPCHEMKTDVLLTHTPYKPSLCLIKGGSVEGEYIIYDISEKNKPVILTLGGSTTSGFYQYIANGETYPKYLAGLAKDQFYLINGGMGAYSSLQEFYKFVLDGSQIEGLSVVISLNGINEMPDYQGQNEIRRIKYPFLTVMQYDMNENQKWIDQRVSTDHLNLFGRLTRITRRAELLFSKFKLLFPNFRSLLYAINLNKHDINKELDIAANSEPTNEVITSEFGPVERWEKNIHRLNALVELEGASYFVFLQPTLGLLGPQSAPTNGSIDAELFASLDAAYLKQIRGLYLELKNKCNKIEFCYDISNLVPPTGDVYSNPRHHNASGNKILADEIWTIVSKRLNL